MRQYERHGMRYSSEYAVWAGIVKRCCDAGSCQYEDYGGRGIDMDPAWRVSFSKFFADMGAMPDGATIERIDVNLGYTAENCKWEVDRGVQAYNTRLRTDNTSGKAGVMWNKQKSRWESYIYKDKRRIRLGFFTEKDEAIAARVEAEILYYGKQKEA